ncbi:DUF2163 domain-containing protein [Pseudaminobacter arsenicus]|uniref:DUF2163 domain-containing protein n=1 Tax=Borborobacter arsenicus TaxID=1851146 RepID=A0A432V707_9HYPH|nr:DUF2163 domain-containing protein [Pseudaminobacter arsenicus]RUM97919.1 DUF2163 domain-containing protein [Pseudaminobacter arsenicus]
MRSWSPTLTAMLAGEEVTRCYLIELDNGITPIVRLTNHDATMTVGADVFEASPGFDVTRISIQNGGNPAGLDIALPFDGDGPIYTDHVKAGAWRGATVTVWIADFTNPVDREVIVQGFIGLTDYTDRLAGRIEVVTKADALADLVLLTVQTKCPFEFGGPRCGVNLAPYTVTGTVATVISRSRFTITVSNPSGLNFLHGSITFTSGANAGAKRQVRNWIAGTGMVELVTGFPFDIEPGDAFSIHAGCALTRPACAFYNNENRFGGFDKTPGDMLGAG